MGTVFDLLGKVDNLHDPVPTLNHRSAVLGVVISVLILAWICGGIRLYTRFFVLRCPGWDDLFLILANISALVMSIGTCLALDYGLGKHFIQFPLAEMQGFIKTFYVANAGYPMATTFIKLALLFQYLRLFERRALRLVTITMIVITSLWGIAYSFIAWFPAFPVSAYWDWSITDAVRYGFGSHDPGTFAGTYISHVASNVLLNMIVLAIPVPVYFDPEVGRRGRFGLLALFVIGTVVNGLSTWRLVSIVKSRAGTYPTLDPSWYGCVPIVVAALEVNLATICASLPVFWPVIEQSMGWIFVTQEVHVTREVRRFSTMEDEAELYVLPPVVPTKKRYSDPFVRWHVDPLRDARVSKTTVETTVPRDGAGADHRRGRSNGGFKKLRKDSKDSLSLLNV